LPHGQPMGAAGRKGHGLRAALERLCQTRSACLAQRVAEGASCGLLAPLRFRTVGPRGSLGYPGTGEVLARTTRKGTNQVSTLGQSLEQRHKPKGPDAAGASGASTPPSRRKRPAAGRFFHGRTRARSQTPKDKGRPTAALIFSPAQQARRLPAGRRAGRSPSPV
jgi:hypothetical protein